jgi:LuxR family maltose regulon positive regulatory protein
LLADWAQTVPDLVAWLSLDSGDNDPARFWRHVAGALDQVCPGIAERITSLLGPPTPATFEGITGALINDLASRPDQDDVALILDDYHVIDSQLVHASLVSQP